MEERTLLGVVDYVIFTFMLLVSASIGVYFRFSGGKQQTTDEYLLAGRDMGVLPVAFSLMASFLSAITVIGVPAEMYRFGIHIAYMNIGYVIGMVVSAYVTLPVFFELNASTAYEYLERRFGKIARTLTSVVFVFQMILYMSVVLYAPALALSAVTNLSTWVSVVSIGVVCTFYCTLGGMKAVLWTDVFQALLMFLGIFAILIKGFLDIGFSNVYSLAYEGGRLAFPG
ncbi:putative sodium-dependent multivitamin transporter [Caerostris darwini]|uniref:Sodium-dependent multivitamin transporter n=1 Tax=Caerostris darwini TaxID=1538125 RepID=A0AAV4M5E2_9ARAC|nr:putative sodium-dependent multivitamin transporter [Caerostris darwini]